MATEPTLSSLAAMAEAATPSDDFTDPSSSTSGAAKTKEQLRRHYIRALHKVINEADIIVMVLDARDPEGCRSRLVEEEVRRRESEGKRLVFVLNKIGMSVILSPSYLSIHFTQISSHATTPRHGFATSAIPRPPSPSDLHRTISDPSSLHLLLLLSFVYSKLTNRVLFRPSLSASSGTRMSVRAA